MQAQQERLPGRSNCKGPARATVCSHSLRDMLAPHPQQVHNYEKGQRLSIRRNMYNPHRCDWHLFGFARGRNYNVITRNSEFWPGVILRAWRFDGDSSR
jgi:hypothetical protein